VFGVTSGHALTAGTFSFVRRALNLSASALAGNAPNRFLIVRNMEWGCPACSYDDDGGPPSPAAGEPGTMEDRRVVMVDQRPVEIGSVFLANTRYIGDVSILQPQS